MAAGRAKSELRSRDISGREKVQGEFEVGDAGGNGRTPPKKHRGAEYGSKCRVYSCRAFIAGQTLFIERRRVDRQASR
jgi:hypothetical protein